MSDSENIVMDPGPDEIYWDYLNKNQFKIQHCSICNKFNFPPSMNCRNCGNESLHWQTYDGEAHVYSTTTVRTRNGDYNVAIIELETGARIMSRVDNVEPEKVFIGQKVSPRIITGDDPHVIFTKVED